MADQAPHVRVTVKDTGAHITITRELYDANPAPYTELKGDPYGTDGAPAPAEYPQSSASSAASTKAASTEEKS